MIFLKKIQSHNAAIFAGAGLSVAAGYVNWKELMRAIAYSLGLDVNKDDNLISVAQYHCNQNGGKRSKLNQLLIDEFLCVHDKNL